MASTEEKDQTGQQCDEAQCKKENHDEPGQRPGRLSDDTVRILTGDNRAVHRAAVAIRQHVGREGEPAGHQSAKVDGRVKIAEAPSGNLPGPDP